LLTSVCRGWSACGPPTHSKAFVVCTRLNLILPTMSSNRTVLKSGCCRSTHRTDPLSPSSFCHLHATKSPFYTMSSQRAVLGSVCRGWSACGPPSHSEAPVSVCAGMAPTQPPPAHVHDFPHTTHTTLRSNICLQWFKQTKGASDAPTAAAAAAAAAAVW
jgi:hypothetical protein